MMKTILKKHTSAVLITLFTHVIVNAQVKQDSISMKFNLGEVVVQSDRKMQIGASINAESINKTEKNNVADALNIIPGVLNAQGRKEDMIYVRGFNLRQVPIYLDGIPIALPYDGFLDLDMMLAGSISEVSIVSGTDAMLYGPNALGGAINIISSRPEEGWSGKLKMGTFTEGNYQASTSLGYSTEKYYTLLHFASVDKADYRLSSDYDQLIFGKKGGVLDNSYKKNQQLDAKFVLTPKPGNEYALAYMGNWGSKGIPPYLGKNGTMRFWQFPKYDKHSFYFLSKTKLTDMSVLKTRVYFDKFDDNLKSYDDSTYSTMTKAYSFNDFYDDYSFGGIATYIRKSSKNNLNVDFQYRNENHQEYSAGESPVEIADQYITFSVVDCYYYNNWNFTLGGSIQQMNSLKAEYFNENDVLSDFSDNDNTAYNGEIGAKYFFSKTHVIKMGVAYKTRFPTMKDRYSQRFGTSIPNPYLKEEHALNLTLDYMGKFSDKVLFKSSAYYSSLKDAISEKYGIDEDNPDQYQLQNFAKAEYLGADASISYRVFKPLTLQVNYSYVDRKNISDPDVKFTDVPAHTIQGAVVYQHKKRSYIHVNFENYSDRYSTSDGLKVDGYFLMNAKMAYGFLNESLVTEIGINNMFDKNYEISEGYPMPGRNMFVSLVYHL